MAERDDESELASLKDRLNYLFETVHPAGKTRYSIREVSEAIRKDQNFEISPAYIAHLCTGERENPGVQQVEALARFFGVPASFLFGDGNHEAVVAELVRLRTAVQAKAELDAAAAEILGDPDVRVLAIKARGLSATNLGYIANILDQIRKLEGLSSEEHDAERR